MEKIAVGPQAKNVIDIDASVKENIIRTAKAMGKHVKDITVIVLDRERHFDLIAKIREAGARVRLITDGDVAGGVATCFPDSGIDLLMGTGGSTEAVLAAVPIKILGGEILTRFKPKKESDIQKIHKSGIENINKIFMAENLAKGKRLTFTATGVVEGPLLSGVIFEEHKIITHSLVIRGMTGTIRYITTHHHNYNFDEYK